MKFGVKLIKLSVNGETIELRFSKYHENKRTAIICTCDGEPYGRLTVNIPEVPCELDELHIKTWSENETLAKVALASGFFIDTGKRIKLSYCEAQVWKLSSNVTIEEE